MAFCCARNATEGVPAQGTRRAFPTGRPPVVTPTVDELIRVSFPFRDGRQAGLDECRQGIEVERALNEDVPFSAACSIMAPVEQVRAGERTQA